jgi:hypothetical protein
MLSDFKGGVALRFKVLEYPILGWGGSLRYSELYPNLDTVFEKIGIRLNTFYDKSWINNNYSL